MNVQNQYGNLIRFGFSLVIWVAVTGAWGYVWFSRYADYISQPFYFRGNVLVVGIYGFLLYFFTAFYGGYRLGYHKRGDIVYSGVLALLILNILTYAQTSLLAGWFANAVPILVMTMAQGAAVVVWGLAVGKFYAKVFAPQELLMVYGGENLADNLHRKMLDYPENYAIRDTIDISAGINDVCSRVAKYDGVILCDLRSDKRNDLLKFCFQNGIQTYITPKITDIIMRGASEMNLFDTPLLHSRNSGLTIEQRFVKRLMDITLSVAGLVLLMPVMLAVAAAVKLHDGGPVFYSQNRLTRGGKVFRLYKFRSMVVDAEAQSGAQLAAEGDSRITSVGKVIRRFRLDELPQLFCSFLGSMSLVGPRPERPELAEEYQKTIPEFAYRLKVKPGITGLAQTVGRYNTTAYDKLMLDLTYISTYSIRQDIKTIFRTIRILFAKESTEGVRRDG